MKESHILILQQLKDIIMEKGVVEGVIPYVCIDPYNHTIYSTEILYSLNPVCGSCLKFVNYNYPFAYTPFEGVRWPEYTTCLNCDKLLNIKLTKNAVDEGLKYFKYNVNFDINIEKHRHHIQKIIESIEHDKQVESLSKILIKGIPIEMMF